MWADWDREETRNDNLLSQERALTGKATAGFKVISPQDEQSSTTYLDPWKALSCVQETGEAISMTSLVKRDRVSIERIQGWERANNKRDFMVHHSPWM